MYVFINALILAVLVPASGAERVVRVEDGPACSAQLEGHDLTTTLELPTGTRVEAPWRVVHTGEMVEGKPVFVMFATLDRVIERNPKTGSRSIVPFPEPVSLAFEGHSQTEVVQRAAQVWCVTVMRAQENDKLQRLSPEPALGTRVAVQSQPRPLS
jgi:hypothetical protein